MKYKLNNIIDYETTYILTHNKNRSQYNIIGNKEGEFEFKLLCKCGNF